MPGESTPTDSPSFVEADPLRFEQRPLKLRGMIETRSGDFPLPIDYTPPGYLGSRIEGAEQGTHRARGARSAREGRDLPIARHPPPGDRRYGAVDSSLKGRHRVEPVIVDPSASSAAKLAPSARLARSSRARQNRRLEERGDRPPPFIKMAFPTPGTFVFPVSRHIVGKGNAGLHRLFSRTRDERDHEARAETPSSGRPPRPGVRRLLGTGWDGGRRAIDQSHAHRAGPTDGESGHLQAVRRQRNRRIWSAGSPSPPGAGAKVEAEIPVGIMPADNDGAHGLTVSPDGRHWYVTIAHGTPFGYVWKFRHRSRLPGFFDGTGPLSRHDGRHSGRSIPPWPSTSTFTETWFPPTSRSSIHRP